MQCKEPTSVQLVISTNVPFVAGATRVGVYAARSSAVEETSLQALQDTWGPDGNVGTITVVPGVDSSDPVYVRVVMGIGRDPEECRLSSVQRDGCIVARRRVNFVKGEPLVVPVRLHLACNGVLCTADTTCNVIGTCVSSAIDGEQCKAPGGCEVEGDGPSVPGSDAGIDARGDGAPQGGDGATDAGQPGNDAAAPLDASADASGSDGGQDAAADAGKDSGTDAGGSTGDGGAPPGTYSPCTDTIAVDPEAAWPVLGGCANRGNRSRLPGPHALPAKRTLSLQADTPTPRILAGRVVGNTLQVFVNTGGGVRAVNVPMGGGALSLGWGKTPTPGAWYSGLGPDGTLYLSSSSATYALDPATGNELAGWAIGGAPSIVTDLVPVPGPARGVFLAIAGSGGALCRRNASTNQWCVTEFGATPGHIAVAPDGDVLWAWSKSTNRSAFRLNNGDGTARWGPVQTNSSVPPFPEVVLGPDRTFFFAQNGGSPHYVQAQAINNGSTAWGPINLSPSNASGRTLLADDTKLVTNEVNHGLVAYNTANGSPSILLAGALAGGLVSDRDGWIFLAENNALSLRAYAPPYAAESWNVATGNSCGAPILAAGFIIVMCGDTLQVVGP